MTKRRTPYFRRGQKLYIRVNVPDYPGKYYWSVGVRVIDSKNGKYILKIVDTHLMGTSEGVPRKYIKRLKGMYFRARKKDMIRPTNKQFQFYDKRGVIYD